MDTKVHPPAPPLGDLVPVDGSRPPRRGRTWLVVVVVTLVLALTVAFAWIANVEPLGRGSVGFGASMISFVGDQPAPSVAERDIDAFGVTGSVFRIPVRAGTTFTYRFTIRNDGPFPVQITDLGTGGGHVLIERTPVGVDVDIWDSPRVGDDMEPFRAFTLSPDGEAAIEVEVRVADDWCAEPGGWTSWWWEPVTFRVLGIERRMDAETGAEIRLLGTDERC